MISAMLYIQQQQRTFYYDQLSIQLNTPQTKTTFNQVFQLNPLIPLSTSVQNVVNKEFKIFDDIDDLSLLASLSLAKHHNNST